jgi:serine/threonine protein kinase/Tfp pilus assembly protein PilF
LDLAFRCVTTKDKQACATCGTLIPAGSVFCPVCALRGALGSETVIAEPSPEPAISTSRLRFDHYEILAREDGMPLELGRGAMGVTYKAIDVNLRRAVALKVINAKFIGDESVNRRLVREARAAASVRHSNVASVFHLGTNGDSYFYAMEFVDGESLDKVIRQSGRLDPSTALNVTALVAAGLEAIDKEDLVHRDIKPSNIMVSMHGDANAKIIDLGLAKGTAADNGSISEISIQGGFAGTPQYASPEQFAGVGADIRSDLYSLGITLWEMLAGEVPFKGTAPRLIYQHQDATLPVDKLTHVPQPVIALLEKLLEKDPARRFQTPTELLEAIPRVTAALSVGRNVTADQLQSKADDATTPPKQSPRGLHQVLAGTKTRTFQWLLASALSITGLVLVWFFFAHRGSIFNQRGAQAIPIEKSIAVLPFESLSNNQSDSYFADGVQDEILNNLAKIAQLKVISRTSVMQYRPDTKHDLRQIANALGVENVLEGTVSRHGNRVRVSTQLIDARNDHTIWADSYDRDLTDIFAIQSEVAQTIAGKLTATLSPEERKRIETKPTGSLAAYDLYLRAGESIASAELSYSAGTTENRLREAIGFLEQAVRVDPSFTLAYCASAKAHDLLYSWNDPTPERRALADVAVNTALRLQADLPEVHLAYAGHLYYAYRDYERAQVQLAIAKRGSPNNAEAFMLEAYMDRRQGNWEKAIQDINEAVKRDPLNTLSIQELASTLFYLRQFDGVERAYDRLIQLAPDRSILKVLKALLIAFMKTGDSTPFWSEMAALPPSMDEDRTVLSLRLSFALVDHNWQLTKDLIEQMKGGEDDGYFAYAVEPIPIDCYSILIARLRAEQPGANSSFAETRERLNQEFEKSQGPGSLLSQLAVVDALLNQGEAAIAEAKRAVEMLPTSKDAVEGPRIAMNLAVVYAWSNEPDLAFETMGSLTKTPNGIYYGELKRDPYWDPLRKDPRFEKLLAELAPKD